MKRQKRSGEKETPSILSAARCGKLAGDRRGVEAPRKPEEVRASRRRNHLGKREHKSNKTTIKE